MREQMLIRPLVHSPKMAAVSGPWQSQSPGTLSWSPTQVQGSKTLGHHQGAGWKVEQLRLELAPIWYPDRCKRGFSHQAVLLGPTHLFLKYDRIFECVNVGVCLYLLNKIVWEYWQIIILEQTYWQKGMALHT